MCGDAHWLPAMCSQKYPVRHSKSHNNRNPTLGAFLCFAGRRLSGHRGLDSVVVAVAIFVLEDILRGWTLYKDYPGPSRQRPMAIRGEERKRKEKKGKEKECVYTSFSLQAGIICKYLTFIAHDYLHESFVKIAALCNSVLPK